MANSRKSLQLQSLKQYFYILVSIQFLLSQLPLVGGDDQQDLKKAVPEGNDFYSFNVQDSHDNIVSLEKYRGQVFLQYFISPCYIYEIH